MCGKVISRTSKSNKENASTAYDKIIQILIPSHCYNQRNGLSWIKYKYSKIVLIRLGMFWMSIYYVLNAQSDECKWTNECNGNDVHTERSHTKRCTIHEVHKLARDFLSLFSLLYCIIYEQCACGNFPPFCVENRYPVKSSFSLGWNEFYVIRLWSA